MKRRAGIPYLKSMLDVDPRVASDRIILLRNRELGLHDPRNESNRSLNAEQSADTVLAALNQVREKFWSLSLDDLQRHLKSLDLRNYPELAIVVERLQKAAELRPHFPKLAQELGKNLSLFNNFRKSLTMPPRDLAGMKEAIMRSLFEGNQASSYKRAAKIIRDRYPELYAFEPQWFDDIIRARKPGSGWQLPSLQLGIPNWLLFVIVFALVRGCIGAMR